MGCLLSPPRVRLMILISGMSILLLATSAKQIADLDRPA
jgi:hypothetical protein